ncbi:MAG: aminopeptidase P family protein [Candidatus Xenobia bacterium]
MTTDTISPTRPRLDALRSEMRRLNLQGFIVPRADEHQGEYIPPSAARLAWITGFTGSAGAAVILENQAAVFVDGRYTLQAKAEVDASLFEQRHLIQEPPHRWLAKHVGRGARIGYDPWLHTLDQVRILQHALEPIGAEAVPVAENPLDRVWTDRPEKPHAALIPHPVERAGESSEKKRRQIAGALQEEHLDAAVVTAPDSVAWLLNVRGTDVPHTPLPLSFALIHADGTVDWFIDERKVTPEIRSHVGTAVSIHPPTALLSTLDQLKGKRVRYDASGSADAIHGRLVSAGAIVSYGADPCMLPKACKNQVELEGAREAHKRDGASLCRFLAWVDANAGSGKIGEIEASDKLEEFRRMNPELRDLSFPTISGAGSNGAIVHYHSTPATERRITPGELYLVDSGAQYPDGTTDVTRTVAVGQPPKEAAEHFTLVLKGHIALAMARFPEGTSGMQLDALARLPLWQRGLDYDHGTGHGVGSYLGVHEGPQRIHKLGSPVPLKPGMICSDEPGYYRTGAYGIRIENLVAVVPVDIPGAEQNMLGFETLTLAPIDRRLIVKAMLTDSEVRWVDDYHARVRDVITPRVDEATAAWLKQATAPL